jgi:hypothetical protein
VQLDYDGTGDVLYDARDALWAILNTPEVRAFIEAHDISPPYDPDDVRGGCPPTPNLLPIYSIVPARMVQKN